jgi:hypothetical protein
MIQVVVGIWTVVIVVFQTAGVRQRNPAFGDTTQNRSPHSIGCSVLSASASASASASLPETG